MSSAQVKYAVGFITLLLVLSFSYVLASRTIGTTSYNSESYTKEQENKQAVAKGATTTANVETEPATPKLDTADYDKRLLALSHYKPPEPISVLSTTTNASGTVVKSYATTTPPNPLRYSPNTNVTINGKLWPKAQPYPHPGAILPFKRIVAYYGNFYSRQMGILGELEPAEVLSHLADIQAKWEAADPTTPVMPAIEYIAMVAQAEAGADGMYRAMMPDKEIEKAYALAKQINGILILDIQNGLSPLANELPKFKKFLERPLVHLALDPEFSMKTGDRPGTVIGSFNAADINYTIDFMSQIVRANNLPPKVLLVHRFTQNMVQGAAQIKATPEVQVVVVMDGWGSRELKRGTYSAIIKPEPVQFAGIKIFYKNDLKPPSTGIFSPAEVLELNPRPIYIQYQ